MTQRCNENHIFISRIDNQRANLPRILQANVLPRFSAVDRFEDSGAVCGVATNRSFARAGVNHIVIRCRDCDRADRRNRLFIEKWNPVCAPIGCFPDSACDRSEIIRIGLANDAFDCQCAPAAKRTNLSPTHSIEQLFIDRSRRRWGRGWSGSQRRQEKEYRNSENDSNQSKRTVIGRNHPPTVKSLRFSSTGIALNAATLPKRPSLPMLAET